MPFNDKSSPEDIRVTFDISKKALKQGLSKFYKERLILFTETGTELIKE